MKKIILGLIVLFLFTNISCSDDTSENNEENKVENVNDNQDNQDNQDNDDIDNEAFVVPEVKSIETEIVNLINAYRVDNGLVALQLEQGFVKVKAKEHSLYMIDKNAISHDLFDARADEIIKKVKANRVGENVAYGYITAKDVVDAWIASEGHRENILGNYNYFEISAEQTNSGVWYFTNIFIKK